MGIAVRFQNMDKKQELPSDIPVEAIPVLEKVGYLEPDRLRVGDVVPKFSLHRLNSVETTLIGEASDKMTSLIFASYT